MKPLRLSYFMVIAKQKSKAPKADLQFRNCFLCTQLEWLKRHNSVASSKIEGQVTKIYLQFRKCFLRSKLPSDF